MKNIFILICLIYIIPICATIIFNSNDWNKSKSDIQNKLLTTNENSINEPSDLSFDNTTPQTTNYVEKYTIPQDTNVDTKVTTIDNPISDTSNPVITTENVSTDPTSQKVTTALIEKKIVYLDIDGVGNYKIDYNNSDMAYNILERAIILNNIPVKYKNYGSMGVFIECINNVCQNRNQYWALIYNGNYSQSGASTLKVFPNDIITWKYVNI